MISAMVLALVVTGTLAWWLNFFSATCTASGERVRERENERGGQYNTNRTGQVTDRHMINPSNNLTKSLLAIQPFGLTPIQHSGDQNLSDLRFRALQSVLLRQRQIFQQHRQMYFYATVGPGHKRHYLLFWHSSQFRRGNSSYHVLQDLSAIVKFQFQIGKALFAVTEGKCILSRNTMYHLYQQAFPQD
jgi:hypothetical protein